MEGMRDGVAGVFDENTDTEAVITRVLGGTLVLSLLIVVAFTMAPIGTDDTYTEFYVLNSNGTASEYPENVTAGEPATLRIGIGNFENRQRTYTLVVRTNETTLASRTVTLDSGKRWEEPVSITFESSGSKRLRLELYTGQTTVGEPYRSLQLFVTVRDQDESSV